jgi:hypothetical protein
MSFLFVQLAAYSERSWPEFRAAQQVATQLPRVGYVTAIDLGDVPAPNGAIHPRRKQEVGRRLALVARNVQYGQGNGLVHTGPTLEGVQFRHGENDDIVNLDGSSPQTTTSVRMSFTSETSETLHLFPAPDCDKCCNELPFHVLIDDGEWVRVDGTGYIDQSTAELHLSVTMNSGSRARGIRYAWEAYPQCLLYNGVGGADDHTGIAASPFEWCASPSGRPAWTGKACDVGQGRQQTSMGRNA